MNDTVNVKISKKCSGLSLVPTHNLHLSRTPSRHNLQVSRAFLKTSIHRCTEARCSNCPARHISAAASRSSSHSAGCALQPPTNPPGFSAGSSSVLSRHQRRCHYSTYGATLTPALGQSISKDRLVGSSVTVAPSAVTNSVSQSHLGGRVSTGATGAGRSTRHARNPAAALLARRRGSSPAAASAAAAAADSDADADEYDDEYGDDADDGPSSRSADLDDLLLTPGEEVPYYIGPLELREVPDGGVGVFVTEDVTCGCPLLVCYPLALLRGRPTGQSSQPGSPAPSPLELARALEGAPMSPLAAAWMMALYDGTDDIADDDVGGGGGSHTTRRLGLLRQLFRQPFDADSAAPAEDTGGSAGGGAVRCPLAPESVARVVTFNAYGEARPDPAVAALRLMTGEQLGGCVGLWPPFSLINHSCAPVASYGLVGDAMVVRAASDLRAGQQVTISYFGRRALAPLELRRGYLAQHYGFICGCERCTLEANGEEEGTGEGEELEEEEDVTKASGRRAAGATGGRGGEGGRLPAELPAFLEDLQATCSKAVAPHLLDIVTGRRWLAASTTTAVSKDEPVSELVDELSELYGYLSEAWQQLLRAAAAAAGHIGSTADKAAAAAPEATDGLGTEAVGGDALSSSGGGAAGGLSQQEVLWLESSVFVLLDQLLVLLGTLGLLKRVQEDHERGAVAARAGGGGGSDSGSGSAARKAAAAAAAAATAGLRRKKPGAAAGAVAKGRGKTGSSSGAEESVVEVVSEGGGSGGAAAAAAAASLTAAAAIRLVTGRRWRVEQLPRSFLTPYVDLLAQAQEVAAAVAPGSDLSVACSVRLLYGIRAVLGADSDEFRAAEISCYDALSARYGTLEYDMYEQVLEVCGQLYSAQEVRLPGLSGSAATAAGTVRGAGVSGGAAAAGPPALLLPGGPYVDGRSGDGEMVGLRVPATAVEAEVVED